MMVPNCTRKQKEGRRGILKKAQSVEKRWDQGKSIEATGLFKTLEGKVQGAVGPSDFGKRFRIESNEKTVC